MAAIHLANAVGGNIFLGFISAVAFATILAVVAGLTLSALPPCPHDLYATVFKKGNAGSAAGTARVPYHDHFIPASLLVPASPSKAEHRLHGVPLAFKHRCVRQLPGAIHVRPVEGLYDQRVP